MSFRFHADLRGSHVHVRVFSGPKDNSALNGTLVFTPEEWAAFQAAFPQAEVVAKPASGNAINHFLLVSSDSTVMQPVSIEGLAHDVPTCSGCMSAVDMLGGDTLSFFQGRYHLVAVGQDLKELWRLENILLVRWKPCVSVTRFVDCAYVAGRLAEA